MNLESLDQNRDAVLVIQVATLKERVVDLEAELKWAKELQKRTHDDLETACAQIDADRLRARELEAALREVIEATERQLSGHGKGLTPSIRLEAAFTAARAVLERSK